MSKDIVPSTLKLSMNSWRLSAKPWKPHPYQEQALKLTLQNQFFGLLFDPGLGKTSVALAATVVRLAKKLIKRVLVAAPRRVMYEVWPEEISSWEQFAHLNVAILHGANKEKILRNLTPSHNVVLTNYETFDWLFNHGIERIKLLGADALIVDESSKIKNSQTVRFKAIKPHLADFKFRNILTGSPRPNNYEDLFGQIYMLDRGVALGCYITHYRNMYFYPTGFEMREWALLPGSEEKINKAVAPMVIRADALDHLKMPKTPERDHFVTLPPDARKMYDAIENELFEELFDEPLTSSAAVRSKCAQIANGAVYSEPIIEENWSETESLAAKLRKAKREVIPVHTAKLEALADLVEELQGEPLLLGIGYRHDVSRIREFLNKEILCINGATTDKQLTQYKDLWNRGKLDLMMIHPASGGHGLNLQKSQCRHVGFFDITDNFDNYHQTFLRVCRQGNNSPFVMKHHFLTRGTVDIPKMRNLKARKQGQKAFLDAMKIYRRERVKTRA